MGSSPSRPKTLSAAFVKTVTEPGRYGDGRGGHGLSLLVKPMLNGRRSKSWSQRVRIGGKPANIGLGSYPVVTLAAARAKALVNARAIAEGRDPRGGGVPTFETAAEIVIELHEPSWRAGGRTAEIWRSSLRDHVMPKLGRRKINEITVGEVLATLLPVYQEKRELGRKLKQRISAIMRWAVAEGHREDDPAGPAINAALPKRGATVRHLASLPYQDVAGALQTVDASQAWPATKLCLRFIAVTATRSGEARGATRDEIDPQEGAWRIPASRMKTNREFRVPLSPAALDILRSAAECRDGSGLVFPSATGRVLSDNTLSKLFRENGIEGTVHGLRSSFRDWAAETGKPREIAESALAHVVVGVEGAYFRSDLFERRAALMDAWAMYLSGTSVKVVRLRG